MASDPKPATRIKDPALLKTLHVRWTTCALCDFLDEPLDSLLRLSLHHIHKHRDDVEANLVMLCGSGTTGHHGLVEHADPEARKALERYIRLMRTDTFGYLTEKLRSAVAADDFLRRLATPKEERR